MSEAALEALVTGWRKASDRAWNLSEEQAVDPRESVYGCSPINAERSRTFADCANQLEAVLREEGTLTKTVTTPSGDIAVARTNGDALELSYRLREEEEK